MEAKESNYVDGDACFPRKKQRKGTEMTCLPRDIEEEVLSRVPVRFLRELRSTSKNWNSLAKSESFLVAKKKQRKGVEVVVMMDYRVSLMSLLSPSIECIGNLHVDDGLGISKIAHCYGLLLLCCITKHTSPSNLRLLVWNPFLGQTRWIEPTSSYHRYDIYGLGYDKEKKEHKVLRFLNYDVRFLNRRKREFEIYNFHSNSWYYIYDKQGGLNPPYTWHFPPTHPGLSLKGNTYWFAKEKKPSISPPFLVSFDYTTERFGPPLPLPFHSLIGDTVTLSSVREEQLAVLFLKYTAENTVKIWITTKIEPNGVSWSNLFVAVDTKPYFSQFSGTFFLADEENKVAVLLGRQLGKSGSSARNVAYIIGNNGYIKQVDLGEGRHERWCYPRVCSYVPSLVQIAPP